MAQHNVFDVIVVGGGIMGNATAYECAKVGCATLLLEQYEFLHDKGSSHGESRIIRTTYPEEHFTQWMKEAYELWDQAEKESGFKVFTQTGGIDFGHRTNPEMQELLNSCKKYAIKHDVLTPAQVAERFPGITLPADDICCYSYASGVLHADNARLMFLDLARKHGAILKNHSEVVDIRELSDQLGRGGDPRLQVVTKTGDAYVADKVVLTVGGWAKSILSKLLPPHQPQPPLVPIENTVTYWRIRNPPQYHSSRYPVFINYGNHIYGIPAHEYPDMLKVGFHNTMGPECNLAMRGFKPDPAAIEHIRQFIIQIFNGDRQNVDVGEPAKVLSCLYTVTPDEGFIIDFVPHRGKGKKNVIVGAGFSGHGFKMAPLIGKFLRQLAVDGNTDTDISSLSWNRPAIQQPTLHRAKL